ncbi:MAG: HD domain-containing protein [Idiomarina sp.]|nr:HD domain-containing protein [Idiomarina sp.]
MVQDLAHDLNHVLRVVRNAKALCEQEQASFEIVVPAAYLHDCVSLGKAHPERHKSSLLAADKAIQFLTEIGYPAEYYAGIHHAIAAHSFSAKIQPTTKEAEIVQDADRLDALGAIGIARCLQVGSQLERALYAADDSFCEHREPNDTRYTLDHFYAKLLSLSQLMRTKSAKIEAEKRTEFMRLYLSQLKNEVSIHVSPNQ